MKITQVIERSHIVDFLKKRNLLAQYKKAKIFLLSGELQNIQLKIRQPKKDKIYYFRINKQFCALCYIEDSALKVFKIDNHQN